MWGSTPKTFSHFCTVVHTHSLLGPLLKFGKCIICFFKYVFLFPLPPSITCMVHVKKHYRVIKRKLVIHELPLDSLRALVSIKF